MSNTQITSQAEKLALIRESERMTRKQVAELTGINYNTYAGYEQGKVKMSFDAGMKFSSQKDFASTVTGSCLMKLIPLADK